MPKTIRICKAPECQNAAARKRQYCSDDCMLWSKVDRSGGPDACWPWMGKTNPQTGYGQATKHETAHRRAYRLYYGIDPGELCVLHKCDFRTCSNPSHLFLGDHAANWWDAVSKGRTPVVKPKLTTAEVLAIRKSAAKVRDIARQMGVTARNILHIKARDTWKHLPDIELDGDPGEWVFVSGIMDRAVTSTTQLEA